MPLFKSRQEETSPAPPRAESPTRKGSLFRRRYHSLSNDSYHTSNTTNSSGFFGRRSSSSDRDNSSIGRGGGSQTSKRSGGLFGFGGHHDMSHDPSIMAARQKVSEAEDSEHAADRALAEARSSVRDAREHVKFLEQEAKEE